jgi:hypothetical protein
MPTYKKRPDFFNSEDGVLTLQVLEAMAVDSSYNTEPSYSANTMLYPNNLIPFVDKHMIYLRDHPRINPQQYISNLRLMTKIK